MQAFPSSPTGSSSSARRPASGAKRATSSKKAVGRPRGSKNRRTASKAKSTRRPRATSAPATRASASRRGRPPTGITEKKQDFIRAKLKVDATISRNQMSELIKTRFGTMLATPKISEVYNALGIASTRGRRRGPQKKAARRGSGTPRGTGRRSLDVAKSKVFNNIRVQPEFFVSIMQNGQLDVAPFTSEGQANSYITAQVVDKGVPFTNIGFYAKFPADINVSVTLRNRR